jgi:hypothetical protein
MINFSLDWDRSQFNDYYIITNITQQTQIFNFSKLFHVNAKILSKNKIGDDGINYLASTLTKVKHIISLDLTSINLSQNGILTLVDALKKNESVVDLNIGSYEGVNRNRVSGKALSGLVSLLK